MSCCCVVCHKSNSDIVVGSFRFLAAQPQQTILCGCVGEKQARKDWKL